MNASNYVKILLRSSAILNIENDDINCLLWLILAHVHPSINSHSNRYSNYSDYISELNIDGFDFSKWLKCSGVHKFEKKNNLSIKVFELSFHQNQTKWNQKFHLLE